VKETKPFCHTVLHLHVTFQDVLDVFEYLCAVSVHLGVLSDSHTLIKFLIMEKVVIIMNLISVSDKKLSVCGNSKLIHSITVFFFSPLPVITKCPYKYI